MFPGFAAGGAIQRCFHHPTMLEMNYTRNRQTIDGAIGLGGLMKNLSRTLFLAALFSGAFAFLGVAQETKLIEFEIKDQFHNVHRDSDYKDCILVVIGSDKNGSKFNSGWGEAIANPFKDALRTKKVVFLPVADVQGVPFFLKGMVRGKFPEDPDKWALTDWKGRFAKAYKFEPKAANILVFDQRGELAHRTHGREVEPDILEAVVRSVQVLLDEW